MGGHRGDTEERDRGMTLGHVLGHVDRQVARRTEGVLAGDGLTVDQWRVLHLLADGQGHPMSEIATTIVVPGPTLTKLIDKLVESATVYRLVDARDRRRVLAFLSDSGRDLHARLLPAVSAAEVEALAVLGPDAPQLLDLLARLANGLADEA